jgi:hypothetical protein
MTICPNPKTLARIKGKSAITSSVQETPHPNTSANGVIKLVSQKTTSMA